MSPKVMVLAVPGATGDSANLWPWVPREVRRLSAADDKRAIPAIARDPRLTSSIEHAVRAIPTRHPLVLGDSRAMSDVPDGSVHLAVTSPPYWTLKNYPQREGQLGRIAE